MTDSDKEKGGFDAEEIVRQRESSSITSNPTLLMRYLGFALIGAFTFTLIATLLNFRILPPQYPAIGNLAVGGIVGFGFALDRDWPLPKRILSGFGYLLFAYAGGLIFPPPGLRLRSSVFTIGIIFGIIFGGAVWSYLRGRVLKYDFTTKQYGIIAVSIAIIAAGFVGLGLLGSEGGGTEINHQDGEPSYLGPADNHEIQFETIDYISNSTGNDSIRIDFGQQIPPRTNVIITFYEDGVWADQISQRVSQDGGQTKTIKINQSELRWVDSTDPFTGYEVRIIQMDDDPNVGPEDPQPPERCEDENVSPENDDPMKPNCDTNPYD